METFIINGGKPINGTVTIGGAKNVALKILIASLLTDEEIIIHNVPILRDVLSLIDVLKSLGVTTKVDGHTLRIRNGETPSDPRVPLDIGARLRTSSMVLGPLLARYGKGTVPNPGGCRLGARPIDRHIDGLRAMGAVIDYTSEDGFFHATAKELHGAKIRFPKNTHTGTESIVLAAVLARGQTIIENAAEEVEVDDLINCLNAMGAKIHKTDPRTIVIDGVAQLHGVEYTIMPDRNEEVTFAIAAALTGGSIVVEGSQLPYLEAFLDAFTKAGGTYEKIDNTHTKYGSSGEIKATDILTAPYPGFMTDWQAPWAILMTQAKGISTIHESVFESRFSYVAELKKMGAHIDFYDPPVLDPESFYNFNWNDRKEGYHQAIQIHGPTKLHNAVLFVDDIRAGASLVLAALTAPGDNYLHGVELIDRGYESLEERLTKLGAVIRRTHEKEEV
jgi:UDP-N-acetylglucosamine 1-carboxyvinyltransferase